MIEIGIDNQELQDAIIKMSGEEGINRYAKRAAHNEVIEIEKKLVGAFIVRPILYSTGKRDITTGQVRSALSSKSNSLLSDKDVLDCINRYLCGQE